MPLHRPILAVSLALVAVAGCSSSGSGESAEDPATAAPSTGSERHVPPSTGSGQDGGATFQPDSGTTGSSTGSCTVGGPNQTCVPADHSCAAGTQTCMETRKGEITSGQWGECKCGCTAGSKDFTNVGNDTFVVPPFATMTVEVWGGGSGGVAFAPADKATSGGDSSFNGTVKAGGGQTNGHGGVASGGATNTAGGNNQGVPGGDAPNGGKGGKQSHVLDACINTPNGSPAGDGENGHAPGGAGMGDVTCQNDWMNGGGWGYFGTGGGAGAYAKITYKSGELAAGTNAAIVVGAGGHGSKGQTSSEAPGKGKNPGYYTAGDGAPGEVKISWTCP